ncbi:MAG: hypothetical protein CBD71_04395 [Rickettsiales bacterium TMED211]|nr:MAG: hypothetical protein CBD71_04395 [Rickettsiales bacterium TMED211]|tara:strand:+ start:1231 stop:1422 length:192 start_codon:yes stop_codon:yes gene_type:complete
MILISYTNNETVTFNTVSTAKQYTLDLLKCDIHAVKIRANNGSNFSLLQDYIAMLYKLPNSEG